MNLSSLRNSRGLTLVELTVAMAITSILLVVMVSASLFVQRYLNNWQKRDDLSEELASLSSELAKPITTARQIRLFDDSMKTVSAGGQATTLDWHSGQLTRNGRSLTRSGIKIDSLSVARTALPNRRDGSTLEQVNSPQVPGVYEVFVRISDARAISDSLRVVVKNEYEYYKYKKE